MLRNLRGKAAGMMIVGAILYAGEHSTEAYGRNWEGSSGGSSGSRGGSFGGSGGSLGTFFGGSRGGSSGGASRGSFGGSLGGSSGGGLRSRWGSLGSSRGSRGSSGGSSGYVRDRLRMRGGSSASVGRRGGRRDADGGSSGGSSGGEYLMDGDDGYYSSFGAPDQPYDQYAPIEQGPHTHPAPMTQPMPMTEPMPLNETSPDDRPRSPLQDDGFEPLNEGTDPGSETGDTSADAVSYDEPAPGNLGRTYQRPTRPIPVEKHPRTGMLEIRAPADVEVTVEGLKGYYGDDSVWHFESEKPLTPGVPHIFEVDARRITQDGRHMKGYWKVRLIPGRVVELDI